MTNLKEIYYNTKNGIFNLIVYFKVIWNMRNWDSIHPIELFAFSLEQLKKAIDTDNLHEWTKKDKRKIAMAVEHLKRYKDESIDWYMLKSKKLDETFNIPIENRRYDINENGIFIDKRKSFLTESAYKIRQKLNLDFYKENDRINQYHLEEAFKLLLKHSRKWWT